MGLIPRSDRDLMVSVVDRGFEPRSDRDVMVSVVDRGFEPRSDRDVMVSVVDRGFEPRSDQTKDCKTGICWFSSRHDAAYGVRAKIG